MAPLRGFSPIIVCMSVYLKAVVVLRLKALSLLNVLLILFVLGPIGPKPFIFFLKPALHGASAHDLTVMPSHDSPFKTCRCPVFLPEVMPEDAQSVCEWCCWHLSCMLTGAAEAVALKMIWRSTHPLPDIVGTSSVIFPAAGVCRLMQAFLYRHIGA